MSTAETTETFDISGLCDSRFEAVQDAFAENFARFGDVGASVAVLIDGEPVVDLWAGYADKDHTRAWDKDTIVNVYSTTKGVVAVLAHMLADRGLLDFDAPVARYWPEFAQNGKAEMPVRYLLTHQAGLPVIDRPLFPGATHHWDVMVEALAEQKPVWEPGTKHGYHTVTFGWLIGEVIRRITGMSVGAFLKKEVAAPLGADFFIGLPESEDARTADMLRPAGAASGALPEGMSPDPASFAYRSNLPGTSMKGGGVNSRVYRAAEVPAGNGHGNARALARIYGALARGGELGGVRLMSPEAVARAAREESVGEDLIIGTVIRRSLGFMLPVEGSGDARGPRAFGHAGRGGSLGFADPDRKLGFGYAMNQMWSGGMTNPDPRAQSLVRALYGCLES